MARAVVDLLPCDAELARRAAGGDGAAFLRLYDRYSTDVFATALAATGSVEAAAEATQTAFLRILRWPPALGAPDDDVVELLYALALGGPHEWTAASPQEADHQVARLVGVGWLRSETVAEAGARFDADWSVHLWSPPEAAPTDALPEEAVAQPPPVEQPPPRRLRALPRLRLPLPSPAAAAAVLLMFLAGATGTLLLGGSAGSTDTDAASATVEVQPQHQRAEVPARGKQQRVRRGQARLLRQKTLEPLLAP